MNFKSIEDLKLKLKVSLGAIVKTKEQGGVTICNDTLYSTKNPTAGVCAHHGGWRNKDDKRAVKKPGAEKVNLPLPQTEKIQVEKLKDEIKEGDIFYSKNNGDKAIIRHIEMDGFGFGREVVVYESYRYDNDKKKQLWNGITKFDKQDFLNSYQKEFKHTPIALDEITSHLKQLVKKETIESEIEKPKKPGAEKVNLHLPQTEKITEVIGAIINAKQINDWTRCADDTYSTAVKKPCRTRGGVHAEQKKITLNNCTDKLLSKYGYKPFSTYLVPIGDIMTDEKTFQNRVNDYSSDSTNKIIAAVKSGEFIWEKFDPIILLKHKNYQKLVVLSGHSRTAAFKQLGAKYRVNELDFTHIPAKIIETDLKTAKDIALNSNTLATPETVIERAIYYRKKLQSGANSKSVLEEVKKNELANWTLVWALTFLNERGKTMNALNMLQGKSLTSNENLKQVAFWIGKTRERNTELTNAHEDEMYDYLIKNYGKTFTRLDDFQEKIRTIITQRKSMFEDFSQTALNLNESTLKSVYKQEYEAQEIEIRKNLDLVRKERERIQKGLVAKGAKRDEIDKRLASYDMSIRTQELKLAEHIKRKGDVLTAERNQTALFGFPAHNEFNLNYIRLKLKEANLI